MTLAHETSAGATGVGDATPADPTDSPSSRRPAPLIAGYEIEGELGRGAMGVVYRARQVRLNRPCALKVILAGAHADPATAVRFLGEAEAVAKLQHSNIVQIHHIGEADGLPFLELEYLPGGSLDRRLDGTPWPARRATTLVEALARGVAEAHRLGVVHRDLKPSNILIAAAGTPKVADFGLAKCLGVVSGLTATESILGSPSYMAPEQAEGKAKQAGPLADVYALGAILYELLTGRPPFRGSTVLETLEQVKSAEPVAPSRLVPGVPLDAETMALRCLQKEPAKRYGSAAALAEDLRRFLANEPILARRTGPVERAWRWCRRNPAVASLWAALVGVLLAGTAIASFYAVRARAGERLAQANAEDLRRQNYIGRVNLALSECLANNVARALELLDGCPKDLRGWEWDYAWRQCHLDLGTFLQSGEILKGVAFSPDGTRVASVSGPFLQRETAKKGDLIVRDVETGREIFAHRDVPGGFRAVAFSPDGRWIAGGNASDLVVWDAETGVVRSRMTDPGNRDLLLSLAYSPDGLRIIAGYGPTTPQGVGHVSLWDSATGKLLIGRLPGQRMAVSSVAFNPVDREEIALAGGELVELWDLTTTPRQVRAISGHGGEVNTAAFSPDGRYLASGGTDRTLRLWDRATGSLIRSFYGHEGSIHDLAFSPEGEWLLSASADRSLKLWEVVSGRPLADFHGHENRATCVAFSPDGRLAVSGGQDHAVKLWLAARRAPLTFTEHDGYVFGLVFHPKSQWIVSGAGYFSARDRLKLWDASTGQTLEPSFEGCPQVRAVALHCDGRHLATACQDGTVRVWELDTGRPVWASKGQAVAATDVAYSPDGRWLASAFGNLYGPSEPGEVRLWEVGSGGEVRKIPLDTGGVFGVAFSPDGRWLASACGDGIVRIWDTAAPAGKAREFRGHIGVVHRVMFLPDGRLASVGGRWLGSEIGDVRIRDLSTGGVLELRGHTDMVLGLACSPDGRRLVTGSEDKTIKLWDTTTGEEVFTLRGHTAGVICVAFSPDGRRIASGSWDQTVRVWDTSPPKADARSRRGAESRVKVPEFPADPFAR
ncbi:serine/threonine-protein kinase [Tautonia plasticadhaerens]|uniref:serine/threonine-protein kinase n=1 Tax=Tautonia plasticadhaerens TaxID=2527974 RepID=UPI0018D26489|nr:serine/threonine-protein kinase [Tautonia plasticadhaerens]